MKITVHSNPNTATIAAFCRSPAKQNHSAVAAAIVNEHCDFDEEVTVRLLGGDLKITVHSDYTVLMDGPAVHVFDGDIELDA